MEMLLSILLSLRGSDLLDIPLLQTALYVSVSIQHGHSTQRQPFGARLDIVLRDWPMDQQSHKIALAILYIMSFGGTPDKSNCEIHTPHNILHL